MRKVSSTVETFIKEANFFEYSRKFHQRGCFFRVQSKIFALATAQREYASLESVNGIGEKLLVTLDDITYPTRNGIRHVQAWRLDEVI